ncbi:UNVERIFIED_ORG: hypothetical protein J2740_005565 [Rhizobium nepotum]|nr:hypothetical protein [Rhizobium nepotum]
MYTLDVSRSTDWQSYVGWAKSRRYTPLEYFTHLDGINTYIPVFILI